LIALGSPVVIFSSISMVLGPPEISGALVHFWSAVVSLQNACYAVT